MLATKYLLSIIIDSGKLQQGYIAIMLNSLLKFILVVYDGVCEPYVLQTAQNNGTQSYTKLSLGGCFPNAGSSAHTFMGLSAGNHSVKIVPSGCGRNRRSVSASFVV